MIRGQIRTEYNDGVVTVYEKVDTAAAGRSPGEKLKPKVTLRYEEQQLGLQRTFLHLGEGMEVRYVLKTPKHRSVQAGDIVIPNDGNQYLLSLVQYPKDLSIGQQRSVALADAMLLTLIQTKQQYELLEENHAGTD